MGEEVRCVFTYLSRLVFSVCDCRSGDGLFLACRHVSVDLRGTRGPKVYFHYILAGRFSLSELSGWGGEMMLSVELAE